MRLRIATLLVTVLVASSALTSKVNAAEGRVGQCVEYSAKGYCVVWEVQTPGAPPKPGSRGTKRPSSAVVCWWQIQRGFQPSDEFLADYGLSVPPVGPTVVFQLRVCSDGTDRDQWRWVIPSAPATLATLVRGELFGDLEEPVVASDPPSGTASIIKVPVFVQVTNWTGVITQEECAGGVCVTVTATPTTVFSPGEPGSLPIQCAGAGSRYVTHGPSIAEQAAAPGACAYAYRSRTGASGRPSEWPGSVAVTWTIEWSASNGQAGALPSVVRTTALPRSVDEVQTVVVGGSPP